MLWKRKGREQDSLSRLRWVQDMVTDPLGRRVPRAEGIRGHTLK